MHDDDELPATTRIRLTQVGIERCPKLKSHTGVVVGVGRGSSYRVLIDGHRWPVTLHASYIERE